MSGGEPSGLSRRHGSEQVVDARDNPKQKEEPGRLGRRHAEHLGSKSALLGRLFVGGAVNESGVADRRPADRDTVAFRELAPSPDPVVGRVQRSQTCRSLAAGTTPALELALVHGDTARLAEVARDGVESVARPLWAREQVHIVKLSDHALATVQHALRGLKRRPGSKTEQGRHEWVTLLAPLGLLDQVRLATLIGPHEGGASAIPHSHVRDQIAQHRMCQEFLKDASAMDVVKGPDPINTSDGEVGVCIGGGPEQVNERICARPVAQPEVRRSDGEPEMLLKLLGQGFADEPAKGAAGRNTSDLAVALLQRGQPRHAPSPQRLVSGRCPGQ